MGAYYYLVSSLPMLSLEENPPLTGDEFMENCEMQLSEDDLALLQAVSPAPSAADAFPAGSAADKWRQWEICLRNRIAANRGGHGKDISQYTLQEDDWFAEVENGIQEAFAQSNPLEREKYFDRMRWSLLDDLEAKHFFDIDWLCVYKLKLQIREKWLDRKVETGTENLQQILNTITAREQKRGDLKTGI
ncbi:MAG: DUF2764 family protein [Victivallaceae bacterium]